MLFIQTKVFDPSLEGQAVRLSGSLIEGNFIICKVNNYSLDIVGKSTKCYLKMEEFESGAVEMVVLEQPKPTDKGPEKLPFDDIEDEPLPDRGQHKEGFTRKAGSKNFRSDIQIKVDNAHLENILRENIDPLRLEEITKRMIEWHGHDHWNAKSASGFVQYAIKCGKQIKKFGYGQYGFDWETSEIVVGNK